MTIFVIYKQNMRRKLQKLLFFLSMFIKKKRRKSIWDL